jgi:hypothetical protein
MKTRAVIINRRIGDRDEGAAIYVPPIRVRGRGTRVVGVGIDGDTWNDHTMM